MPGPHCRKGNESLPSFKNSLCGSYSHVTCIVSNTSYITFFLLKVYQQALLTWKEYAKTRNSDYSDNIDGSINVEESIEVVALKWFAWLRGAIVSYSEASAFQNVSCDSRGNK
jgi:hypothetical protein